MSDWYSSAFSGLFGSLASIGGSAMQYEYNKALQQNQYNLNQKALKESPSALREGLMRANYNPLLALGNVGNAPTVGGGTVDAPDIAGSGFGSARQVSEIKRQNSETKLLKENTREAEADADIAHAEAEVAKEQSKVDKEKANIELEALGAKSYPTFYDGKGKPIEGYRDFIRQGLINSAERYAYTNSKEHAIAEDAVNALHGGTSAYANAMHGWRDWKRSSSRRSTR